MIILKQIEFHNEQIKSKPLDGKTLKAMVELGEVMNRCLTDISRNTIEPRIRHKNRKGINKQRDW